MPLYAIIAFDHEHGSMPLREKHREAHRRYVTANDQMTRLAGAMYDDKGNQSGTLKIFEADSAEQVWEWYRQEPFYQNNVYREFHVVEWCMAKNTLEQTDWVKNFPTRIEPRKNGSTDLES